MAYREAQVPCRVCDRTPATPCTCCGHPACAAHTDAQGWCKVCTEQWYMFSRKGDHVVPVGKYLLGFAGSALLPLAYLPLIAVPAALLVIGIPVLRSRRTRFIREKFVAQVRAGGERPNAGEEEAIDRAAYDRRIHERISDR